VGHRYVPKIMGEWDKSETYEGLSIVTNKGTSYTSKKRVPKGIDILNEEYWVVTGNYNAQIEEYRKDVRELEKEVEKEVNKKADKTFVDSEIERLEQKDKNLATQLAQNENDLTQYKREIRNGSYKGAIVSFSTDDGRVEDWTRFKPIFEEEKIPCNVCVSTSFVGNEGYMTWEQLKDLKSLGW